MMAQMCKETKIGRRGEYEREVWQVFTRLDAMYRKQIVETGMDSLRPSFHGPIVIGDICPVHSGGTLG